MRARPLALLVALLLLALVAPGSALAYTQTISASSYVRSANGGRACVTITYTETNVAAGSEAVVSVDWASGVVVDYSATLTAGSAATLHTVFGTAASFTTSTQDHFATALATAAYIHESGETPFTAPGGKLYLRAAPNAGSDNSIATRLTVCAGVNP